MRSVLDVSTHIASATLLVLLTLGITKQATADVVPTKPQQQPFLSLDRPGGASSAGADVAVVMGLETSDVAGLRLDPHIEHVYSNQWGFMASLPLAALLTEGENETAMGNIDVGGFRIVSLAPNAKIVFRGSLTLPTASENFAGVITNLVASYARLGDLALSLPQGIVMRGAGSYLYEGSGFSFRGDAGIDVPIAQAYGDTAPLMRVSGGVAVGSGSTKFIAELVNLLSLDSESDTVANQATVGISSSSAPGTFKAALFARTNGIPEDDGDVALGVSLSQAWTY